MTAQERETGLVSKPTDSSVPLHPLLEQRWSPRSFEPATELSDAQFTALFEAARWAPSWGNTQPAHYIAGQRGEPTFDRIFSTLTRGNKSWAEPVSALVIGVAQAVNDEGEPMPYGEYGLGLATQNLVLQAVAEGLVTHQMAGFDREATRAEFAIPAEFEPLVAIAIGRQGPADALSDRLQEKEHAPRSRKDLSDVVYTGSWGHSRW